MNKIFLVFVSIILASCASQFPAPVKSYDSSVFGPEMLQKPAVFSKYKNRKPKHIKDYNLVTVEKGDTLYDIAIRYGSPSKGIININRLTPPYIINVGQKLKIPFARFHAVKSGDTLYKISRKYNINLNNLARLNGLKPPYSLKIGQKIRLPYKSTKKTTRANYHSVHKARHNHPKKEKGNFLINIFHKLKESGKNESFVNNKRKKYTQKNESRKIHKKVRSTSRWNGKFSWPIRGKIISSFGAKAGGVYNDGINILAPKGSPIKSSADGTVVYLGNQLKGYGNLMIIRHDGGWITAYAHQQKFNLKKGAWVKKGQVIGFVGDSGNVSKPQLHFAIRKGRQSYNPMNLL